MTVEEQARALSDFENAVSFVTNHRALEKRASDLEHQVAWFKKQIFGAKSERRFEADSRQLSLGEDFQTASEQTTTTEVPAHKRKTPARDLGEESKVRFPENIPTKIITLLPEAAEGLEEGKDYEVIGVKETERLAQRPSAYVLLRYRRPVIKLKEELLTTKAPEPALPKTSCLADVSLLAGILTDKFQYYLPLFRQHQRMKAQGISISRSLLTTWVQDTAEVLAPVYRALANSVMSSALLRMDEVPVKAGVDKEHHRMKQAWFWPVMGDKNEVIFVFRESRAQKEVEYILSDWKPPPDSSRTLLTDGLQAYSSYALAMENIIHAQCWVHTRRNFVEAEALEPELAKEILSLIGLLYSSEAETRKKEIIGAKKLEHRALNSKPVVEQLFSRLREISSSCAMLTDTPFTAAVDYALKREKELSVFLEDPEVPLDTNDLERQIRPIPLGRKNWLFCWTEIGAVYVGIIQSLIASCKLHGIEPYGYFIDVLSRHSQQPNLDPSSLIPRTWKTLHADNLICSDLEG